MSYLLPPPAPALTPQDQLTALLASLVNQEAIQRSGVLRAGHGDRTVQFQTAADLASAIKETKKAILELQIALGYATRRRGIRQVVFIASKGL